MVQRRRVPGKNILLFLSSSNLKKMSKKHKKGLKVETENMKRFYKYLEVYLTYIFKFYIIWLFKKTCRITESNRGAGG